MANGISTVLTNQIGRLQQNPTGFEMLQNVFLESKKRRQALQDAFALELIKNRASQQQVQQNMANIQDVFRGFQQPQGGAMDVGGGVSEPSMSLSSGQVDGAAKGQRSQPEFVFRPSLSIDPATGQSKVSFSAIQNPALKAERQVEVSQRKSDIIESRNKNKEIRKLEKDLEDISTEIEIIEGDINSLLKTFKSIPEVNRGPIQGRSVGPIFGRFLQRSPEATEYEDARQFFLSNISRKLGGERGVLTDRDIDRVDTLFPQLRDRDEVAEGKMLRIKDFIKRRIENHRNKTQRLIESINKGGSFQPLPQPDIDQDVGFDDIFGDL